MTKEFDLMKRLSWMTAALGLLLGGGIAHAGPILFTQGGIIRYPVNDGVPAMAVGWSFTTGSSAVSVTALDAFLLLGTGQPAAQVRLYNGSGTTLASATVSVLDTTETNGLTWYTQAITPVTLAANTTYYLAQDMDASSPFRGFTSTPTMTLGMTYVGGVSAGAFGVNPTLDEFSGGAENPSYFGPNFDAVAVTSSTPEPSSLALIGAAAASFAGYFGFRRRNKTALVTSVA
jgi:hypothetical protein